MRRTALRLAVPLLLLVVAPAWAQRLPTPGFDGALAERVYAAALDFMIPRTLDPVPASELGLWGLRGLTALDPDLSVEAAGGNLRFLDRGQVLLGLTAPPSQDVPGWAQAAVAITRAAWAVSPAVREAGTQGVIENYFEELLNHLDPYSRYVPPAQAAQEEDRRLGDAGIGVTLERRGRDVVVTQVVADGPAALAGVRPGDRILVVDGQSARGKPLEDVESAIAGADGTPVEITLLGASGRRTLTLERAQVPPENVFASRDGGLLVVRITDFNSHTAPRLATAVQGDSGRQPSMGLVLDLRGNRGGILRQAIDAADAFLPGGVIAVTEGRDPNANHVWRARPDTEISGLPIVVLVDGRTASAAEVLAAALADQGRAVVVGSSTLGKGLVQIVTRLPDGGELVLTWSRLLAPRGWPLQGLGVLPQLCTSLGEAAVVRQLARLAAGEQPMRQDLQRERNARVPVSAAETLAIRQACPAAEGGGLDLDAARRLLADPAAYATALLPPVAEAAVTGRH